MLTSDLLLHRYNGEELVPTRLPIDKKHRALAEEIIGIFGLYAGKKRLELDEELSVLEGTDTDYRVKRGLAHLLLNGFCTFETVSRHCHVNRPCPLSGAPRRMKIGRRRLAVGRLHLLDEPEAALSPLRQLAFLSLMKETVAQGGQFIVATHAPILMAYPDASLLTFGDGRIIPTSFDELEHVKLMRSFLSAPDSYLRQL